MAVDQPVLYNDVWVYLRDSMGNAYGNPTDKQIHNAEYFYTQLRGFGYSKAAACGILGNMQTESGLSPGALESGTVGVLPNNAEHLSDLDNTTMLAYADPNNPGYGTGLIQWDSYTNQSPAGNLIASFAIRYNWTWYDWELQLFRLEAEYILDPSGYGGINGTTYQYWYLAGQTTPSINWSAFKTFTGTPEDAADYFRLNRERSSDSPSGIQHRRDNARWFYDHFTAIPPVFRVTGKTNAAFAYLFRDSQYAYTQWVDGRQMDCIGFVNYVRKMEGLNTITNGTNSLWRDVGGNYLYWRGTLDDCLFMYGHVPVGAYLFKCYPEGTPGYETIPDQYRGDGIGNFDHIGIYTDMGLGVMQSGGYDVTPPGGFNGVHDTRTRLNETPPWWTHVAFGDRIIFAEYNPRTLTPSIISLLLERKKGSVLGRVRRS